MTRKLKSQFNSTVFSEAASLYGVSPETISPVGGFENDVYQFQSDNRVLIMRIGHSEHRKYEEVLAELDFIDYLYNHGAAVSRPVQSVNGNLVECVSPRENGAIDLDYFNITVFQKAPGSHVSRQSWPDNIFYLVGRSLGQFHRLAKNYPLDSKGRLVNRMHWDQDPLLLNAERLLLHKDAGILDCLYETMEEIRNLEKTANNFGLMHGDVHFGNFHHHNDAITIFDFDDTMYFYYISDIAISLFYHMIFASDETKNQIFTETLQQLLSGYREEETLDRAYLATLPVFFKFREIILCLVIHQNSEGGISEWGRRFAEQYRPRILGRIPFINTTNLHL